MPSNIRNSRKQKGRRNGKSGQLGAVVPWSTSTKGPEVKFWTSGASNQALYHNSPLTFGNVTNALDGITQGVGIYQRIGQQALIREMRIRMVLNRKVDRPNVSYRVIVLATCPSGGTDTFPELLEGTAFTGIPIPGVSQILHDVTFPRDQGSSMEAPTKERSDLFECIVPIGRTVAWSKDNTALTVLRTYIIAYDAYGTLVTDNIASIAQGMMGIYFQDS